MVLFNFWKLQTKALNNYDIMSSGAPSTSKYHTETSYGSANFSLVGDLEFPPNCNPNRPYPGLWNYEVQILSSFEQF